MKTKWTKETPTCEGWYWIKYNKTICPCVVIFVGDATMVMTARNVSFVEGPSHGGKGLKHDGKLQKSIRFGPAIPDPDAMQKMWNALERCAFLLHKISNGDAAALENAPDAVEQVVKLLEDTPEWYLA